MKRAALTVGLLVMVATTGCGGGDTIAATTVSEAAYEQRIDDIGNSVFLWFSDLRQIFFYASDLNDAGRKEVDRQIELIQTRIGEQADALEGVIPPDSAAAAHGDLIDALRDYSGELDDFDKAMSGSPSFQDASEKLAAAAEQFEELGYAAWLTGDSATSECSSEATYSWPNAPFCTQ
jgi:hypothetical protein